MLMGQVGIYLVGKRYFLNAINLIFNFDFEIKLERGIWAD